MRFILIIAFLLAFSVSSFAQSNQITVINEDGTKTSIDIGPVPDAPLPQTVTAPPRAVSADPVKSPAAKPVKKIETKPEKKPALKKQAAPKKNSKSKPVKKEAAAKKKKPVAPATKATQKKPVSKRVASSRSAASSAPAQTPLTAAQSAQRLGEAMTSDDAIRIALDVAPAARAVHAIPVNYKGTHAYQVVFTTEDGDRSIFVDRETAKIVQ